MSWLLAGGAIPTTMPSTRRGHGGILATIGIPRGGPVARVRFLGQTLGIGATELATATGSDFTSPLPIVGAVIAGGVTFTPAINPAAPQPGEFTFNPSTGRVVLTTGGTIQVADDAVVAIVGSRRALETDIVPRVPRIAQQLGPTLIGLSWSLSLGDHPSGQLEIAATDMTLPFVRSVFRAGAELSIDGIGFRCGQKTIKTTARLHEPTGIHLVTIPLEGKWLNYVDKPYTLRPIRSEAQLNGLGTVDALPATLDLSDVARAVGARYAGPLITMPTPRDAAPGDSITIGDIFSEDWHRVYGGVPDYNQDDAIRIRPIRQGRVWDYRNKQILQGEISQTVGEVMEEGPLVFNESVLIPPPSTLVPSSVTAPTYVVQPEAGDGIAIKWENVQLTGTFSEQLSGDDDSAPSFSNSTGRARWVQRRRERTVSVEGDPNPAQPPEGAVRVQTVSLNFDQSGPTKTQITTTSEDGFVLLETTVRYGYAATGEQIAASSNPSAHWKMIEFQRKERLVDRQTGYAYGWTTTGWQLGRFRDENAEQPETQDDSLSTAEKALYQYRRLPVVSRELMLLRQHRTFYDDFDDADLRGEILEYTLPDGSKGSTYLRNPNYAESFFVAIHTADKVAFAVTNNPEQNQPRIVAGQEEYSRSIINVKPGRKRVFRSGRDEQPGDRTPDFYSEYTSKFTAQDGSYGSSLEDTKVTDHEGRPSVAERIPPEFVREEPPEREPESEGDGSRTLYLLNSGEAPDWLGRSINYPAARTLDQAVFAARTEATLENLGAGFRETIEVAWNGDIRPGDQIIYMDGGEERRRIVMAVAFNPKFQTSGLVTGTIELQLARWVDAGDALQLSTVRLPGENSTGNALSIFSPVRKGEVIGSTLPLNIRSRTRGNY